MDQGYYERKKTMKELIVMLVLGLFGFSVGYGTRVLVDHSYYATKPASYTPKYPKEVYEVQPIIDSLNQRKNVDPDDTTKH